jgi:hypothetical protein
VGFWRDRADDGGDQGTFVRRRRRQRWCPASDISSAISDIFAALIETLGEVALKR